MVTQTDLLVRYLRPRWGALLVLLATLAGGGWRRQALWMSCWRRRTLLSVGGTLDGTC